MSEGWTITVGDMKFHLERVGNMVEFSAGLLRTDLETVIAEMFGEEAP